MSSADAPTITLSRPGTKTQKQQDIVIPATLGTVRLLNQIGQGGMGIVYRGRDQILGRDVAVKFITNALPTPDDPGFTAFLEGARAAAALQHASLTTVHQAGVIEGVPYIVMQFVDGPTVSELIKTTGPLSGDEALAILIAVAEAIAELHDRSIIHRDIKPSNVLLDQDGHVIVSDFGLAHRRRAGQSNQPSSGTPSYMAPEMIAGEVSPRTDVYALGIMGFELLAGRLPFQGDVTQTQEQHRTKPLPVAELKDVSAEIVDILDRATHKNALFRHKTARQFSRALQAATTSEKIAQGRYAILQRLRRQAAPEEPTPGAPPEPKTYYDHISRIAASKRAERPIAPPPVEQPARHCLHCGYNRLGLDDAQACSECGHPWDFPEHQANCLALARKPGKLWWRLLTLRGLPIGWWEVFDHRSLHRFTLLRAFLVILLGSLLSAAIFNAGKLLANNLMVHRQATAYLYRIGDPEKKKVADYGGGSESTSYFNRRPRGTYLKIPTNPTPGTASLVTWTESITFKRPRMGELFVALLSTTLFVMCGWIVYRFIWLDALLWRRPDLEPAELAVVRNAAAPLALIFLALPVALLLGLLVALAVSRLVPVGVWMFALSAVLLLFPPLAFGRAIWADKARRIFPSRGLAIVLLGVGVIAHCLCFSFISLIFWIFSRVYGGASP
jgi:serine/threonine protein kinase